MSHRLSSLAAAAIAITGGGIHIPIGRRGPRGSQWQCTECEAINRDGWKRCDGCDKPRTEVEG